MPRHKQCPHCLKPTPPAPPLRDDFDSNAAFQHEWQHWKNAQMETKTDCECPRCTTCWDVYQTTGCHCTRQQKASA